MNELKKRYRRNKIDDTFSYVFHYKRLSSTLSLSNKSTVYASLQPYRMSLLRKMICLITTPILQLIQHLLLTLNELDDQTPVTPFRLLFWLTSCYWTLRNTLQEGKLVVTLLVVMQGSWSEWTRIWYQLCGGCYLVKVHLFKNSHTTIRNCHPEPVTASSDYLNIFTARKVLFFRVCRDI